MPQTQTLDLSVIAPELIKSPEEIVEQRKQELTREIQGLTGRSWLHRLATWRRAELERQSLSRGDIESLMFWSILNSTLALGILHRPFDSLNLSSVSLWVLLWLCCVVFMSCYFLDQCGISSQAERRVASRHLLISVIPPLMLFMPLIRIFDLVITSRWGMEVLNMDEATLNAKQRELAELKASTLVPATYRTALLAAHEQFLGESAELRSTEKDLAKRLETVRSQLERLGVRLREAQGDEDREPLLQRALEDLQGQRAYLEKALETVRQTMAKTRAMLDEFSAKITKMSKPFEDAEFLQTCEQGEDANAKAIASAYKVVDRHVERLRASLLALANAVSQHPALPEGDGVSLEAYLLRADEIGKQLATLESREAVSS